MSHLRPGLAADAKGWDSCGAYLDTKGALSSGWRWMEDIEQPGTAGGCVSTSIKRALYQVYIYVYV